MKRFAALTIAVLAAIAASLALVGCDNKYDNDDDPPTLSAVEFDGGELGSFLLAPGEEKRLDFEYDQNNKYVFRKTCHLSDGSLYDCGVDIIYGYNTGENIVKLSYDSYVTKLIININRDTVRLDAKVSFDSEGAISVEENDDGLTEYTYLGFWSDPIPCPDMILSYEGWGIDPIIGKSLVRKEPYDDGGDMKSIDSRYYAYKLTYFSGDLKYPDIITNKNIILNGVTAEIIVKVVEPEVLEEGVTVNCQADTAFRNGMYYILDIQHNGIYTFTTLSDVDDGFCIDIYDYEGKYPVDIGHMNRIFLTEGKYRVKPYRTNSMVGNYSFRYDFTPPKITGSRTLMNDNRSNRFVESYTSTYKFIPDVTGQYSFIQGYTECEVFDREWNKVTGTVLTAGEEYYIRVYKFEDLKMNLLR